MQPQTGHSRATVTVQKAGGKPFRVAAHLLTAFEKRGYRKVGDTPAPEPKEAKKAKTPKPAENVDSEE